MPRIRVRGEDLRAFGDVLPQLEFVRISGMTHVRTSPYYLQSNGKIERRHKSLKRECIRPGTPLSLEDARRLVGGYAEHQQRAFEQRHRIHHAEGHARRASAGEFGQQRQEVRTRVSLRSVAHSRGTQVCTLIPEHSDCRELRAVVVSHRLLAQYVEHRLQRTGRLQ